jgi:hypothetical protein
MANTKDIVHEAYLMALRDERAPLKQAITDGDSLPELARDMLANIKATYSRGWSGDMAHYMRGSRDFWENQVKLHPIAG